jgi:tetratricopeptide (TPR) repeat protein
MRRSLSLALGLLLAMPALARGQAIGPGFELERSGKYADAATVYFNTLRTDPNNIPALLGLERALFVLNRMPELLPLVQRARARAPENVALRSLEVRVYADLNQQDSLEAVVRRWAAAAPQSDAPYREWGLALADRRMYDDARNAYLTGRKTLGGAGTLANELAELEQRAGNWEAAAREWARAVAESPDVEANAASQLSDAPSTMRDRIVRVLIGPDAGVAARRLGAELLLTWGQPSEAWAAFEPTLASGDASPAPAETQAALRRFSDLAAALTTPEAHRVRGLALARWADLVPSPLSERARAEAVRELLDGNDRVGARRVLESHGDPQGVGQAALLQLLIADGQLDVVERRLASDSSAGLVADDRAALQLSLAQARIARGELDRAAAALGDDSSVAALAQRGWIALYRGDLKGAMDAFRVAGPYATDRAAATDRTAMMALLQRVQEPSSPELGAALLTLTRGDSVAAVGALRRAAGRLPVQGGRLEVLLLAGQLAARLGPQQEITAVALFDEVVRGGGEGAAPAAAELEWSRLLIRQGHSAEAIPHLEHLILTYPSSAVVPQARRELERAKGAIPKS